MTVAKSIHADHGATFEERGGRSVVAEYGRPERAGRAVRQGVGVIEMGYGVLTITGTDRVDFVDNAVSNRVPETDGTGCYALLCDPQGRIETDLYIYNADERLLVFCPPDRAGPVAEEWSGKTFIQDVEISVSTTDFGVFGVHGPKSTEKIASVLNHAAPADDHLEFVRGSMDDDGVTVIRTDAPLGEEGYEVVCGADHAPSVLDTLLNRGMNAPPVGYRTWEALTLEAGTPLFETELRGTIPNVLGLQNAVDFEKGCYVGQEVISRVENRGRPSQRLVGLRFEDVATADGTTNGDDTATEDALPSAGAAVFEEDAAVGEVTRAAWSPTREESIAFAVVEYDLDATDLVVRIDGTERPAGVATLPFVEGSDRSARLPSYTS